MKARQWVGAVLVVIALIGFVAYQNDTTPTAAPPAADRQLPDATKSPSYALEPGVTVSPKPGKSTPRLPSEAVALRIPGVLSASFGAAISPNEENALVPPGYTQVYRWNERGMPGCSSKDTVFLLGHTVRAGGGVFDNLQATLPGQSIVLTTKTESLRYEVVSTSMYERDEISEEADVYASVAGRLVLVGCFLNPDGSVQTKNFVVTARLISC